jgi:hypothetical protein
MQTAALLAVPRPVRRRKWLATASAALQTDTATRLDHPGHPTLIDANPRSLEPLSLRRPQ